VPENDFFNVVGRFRNGRGTTLSSGSYEGLECPPIQNPLVAAFFCSVS